MFDSILIAYEAEGHFYLNILLLSSSTLETS